MPTMRLRSAKGSELTHNELDANFKRTVSVKTTTYACLVGDNRSTIECNHATTPFTVTLGDAATMAAAETGDYEVTIANIGAAAVTVARAGSDTIDGAATSIVLQQYSSVTLKVNAATNGYNSIARGLGGLTSTVAELNILDGVTSTAAELNIMDGVTSTAAELNILDGVTATTAELNILDGVTSTTAEINALDADQAATTPTVAGGDSFVMDDDDVGTVKVDIDNVDTYLAQTTKTLTNKTLTSPKINEAVALTATSTELNVLDADQAVTTPTVTGSDSFVMDDADVGTVKVDIDNVDTYLAQTTKTLTNKTLTSPVLNTGVSGTAVLDEDNMASNSATKLATQQSIKAYVDNLHSVYANNANGNGNISDTTYTLSALSQASFHEIGPTGAGNAWAALDSVPTDADWIELRIHTDNTKASGSATTAYDLNIYARDDGSAQTAGTANKIVHNSTLTDSGGNAVLDIITNGVKVPVTLSKFEISWSTTFTSSAIVLVLVGYGYNA